MTANSMLVHGGSAKKSCVPRGDRSKSSELAKKIKTRGCQKGQPEPAQEQPQRRPVLLIRVWSTSKLL